MQEEISKKVIVFTVTLTKVGGRMTAKALKAAMRKYLDEQAKAKTKIKAKLDPNRVRHGKQTVKQLMNQNTGLTNIEITDQNIKSFERVAQKYNIDFALKKDKNSVLPKYMVFFKARDVDVMTAAFKEFSAKEITKSKKPSIRRRLLQYTNLAKAQQKQREKVKAKDRGQEL